MEEDSSLLKGVYEYGMGNWESIKMDSDLHLYDKVSQEHCKGGHLVVIEGYFLLAFHKIVGTLLIELL